ncbi:DUF3253 domain-containing protein [Sphingomonas sp. OK281]|uniref:DUF3253 domain-containing protein n=1 Tax=Sphingomonas sp. OK281 TaxID=1881067 RepID=UPI0008EAD67A|nr:DUF3253 domain-containing protein [Sphingomonas sp. OK281]SFN71466.1 Protein of unknown function [Sphingomonas sp. OK281]
MARAMIDAQETTQALLARRRPGGTVCPSEVARALANAASTDASAVEWRSLMPVVHAAVDRLVATGQVQLSWKGARLASRAGPYRIGRVALDDPGQGVP